MKFDVLELIRLFDEVDVSSLTTNGGHPKLFIYPESSSCPHIKSGKPGNVPKENEARQKCQKESISS